MSTDLDAEGSELNSEEIVEVNGEFAAGDTILVRTDDGTHIAKAKSNYSSCLLNFIAEQPDAAESNPLLKTDRPVISDQGLALLDS